MDSRELTDAESRKVMRVAAYALEAQMAGATILAGRFFASIVHDYGHEGVHLAIMYWAERFGQHAAGGEVPDGGIDVPMTFVQMDEAEVGAEPPSPEVAWAGKVISAALTRNPDTYNAAIKDLPEGNSRHVATVLHVTALSLTSTPFGYGRRRRAQP